MKHSGIRLFALLVASIAAGLTVLVARHKSVDQVPAIRSFDVAQARQVEMVTQNIATSKTLAVNPTDHKASKLLHFNLTRYGAWAEVNCHVSDRFGNPVPDAEVHLFFDIRENEPESKGVLEGKTDQDGCFYARHKTTYACHWRIRKAGFHESRGILPFSNHFSLDEGRKGRWTAEPLTLDVVLDEVSGADLLHGVIYWKSLKFPTNTWVWFDFEAGECVEPHGKGKNRHISFYSEGLRDPNVAIRAGVGWTNYFAFAVPPEGGLSLLEEKNTSNMPFCHDAPEAFDTQKLEFTFARSDNAIFIDANPKKGQYIAFKTPSIASGRQQPHYGIIRKIECWPGGLRMEWFFNKTPDDRRIDGDICSPRSIDR